MNELNMFTDDDFDKDFDKDEIFVGHEINKDLLKLIWEFIYLVLL